MLQDWLSWLLEKFDVVAVVVSANVLLSAAHQVLDKWKDKTSTEADNKADSWLMSWLPTLQKAIDWMTANVKHK